MTKVEVFFPDSDITVTATLLEKEEPEYCQRFWEFIKEPVRMACHHTMSTGDVFNGLPRPTKSPIELGSQIKPIGKNQILFTDVKPGQLVWRGIGILVPYGPCTEPLVIGGVHVAQIDEECMKDYTKACKIVWHYQYFKHQLATMIVRRGEVDHGQKLA